MQYFNQSNSEVEFIKDILRTNYTPTVRIFNTHTNIQPKASESTSSDNIDNQSLISRMYEEVTNKFFNKETIILNNTIQVGESEDNSIVTTKANYIKDYNFGKFYPNISSNFISNKTYYDSELHEQLGRYLRAYRDYYRIDVMNFYNCFSNRFFTTYALPIPYNYTDNYPRLNNNKDVFEFSSISLPDYDSKYKLTAFPILWDTDYKIKFYANNISNITLQAIYFNGDVPLGAAEYDISEGSYIPKIYNFGTSSEFTINIGSLPSKTLNLNENDINLYIKNRLLRQKFLYLFIQFPTEINDPIVVIEQPKFTNAINNSLLNLGNEINQVAFSNTLLEYITGSAITPATSIHKNVHRIQEKILTEDFYKRFGVGGPDYVGIKSDINNSGYMGRKVPDTYHFPPGVFDENLHQIIYKAFFREYIRDKNGYILTSLKTGDSSNPILLGSPEYEAELNRQIQGGFITPVKDFIGYVTKDIEDRIMQCKGGDLSFKSN